MFEFCYNLDPSEGKSATDTDPDLESSTFHKLESTCFQLVEVLDSNLYSNTGVQRFSCDSRNQWILEVQDNDSDVCHLGLL